jgi:hypothetical protein
VTRGLVAVGAVAVLLAGTALAHSPEPTVVRELVWLKGRRAGAEAPLVLVALGAEHHFAVDDLKRFAVGQPSTAPDDHFGHQRLVLQGPREVLARFAGARIDQTVMILAERRPGSTDLFVIVIELGS